MFKGKLERKSEIAGILIDANRVIFEGRNIDSELAIVKKVMDLDLVEVTLEVNESELIKRLGLAEFTNRLREIESKLADRKLPSVKKVGKTNRKNYVTICESSIGYKDKNRTIEFTSLTYETLCKAMGLDG